MRLLRAFIDGACEPNPGGEAGYGVLVLDEDGTKLVSIAGFLGAGKLYSNNVAEYAALGALFSWLKKNKIDETDTMVVVMSDSEILVNQMTGKYRVLKGLYVKWWEKAVDELVKLKPIPMTIYYQHIPRGLNTEADRLASKSLIQKGIVEE